MNAMTLWDLIANPRSKPPADAKAKPQPGPEPVSDPLPAKVIVVNQPGSAGSSVPMQVRYEQVTREMLTRHGVRVRKWRGSMSGVAWQVTYRDGSVSRLIESPKPKGPMSAAIFLHEIGHHAIGFGTYKPRCLEEYYAWKFSIDAMHDLGLNVTDRVHERMHDSLNYAVSKALRRGLKRIPHELLPYTRPRPRRTA